MFISASPDALASIVPPADSFPPSGRDNEVVRHTLYGSVAAVQATIRLLYKLNYAEPNDWSKPIPTGRHNEVMVVLTKRVRL
ncbi:MAG: hypothetical protein WBA76_05475 [Phormidesmis sp.]